MSYELNPKNQTTHDDVVMSNAETLGLISLEPRILLDAAGFVTGAEVAAEAMVAEGAEIGVQAIFDSNDDAQAIPIGGPWLGDVALADSSGTADDSSAVIPIGGPWLGDIALADSSGTADDSSTVIPIGGPWLGDIALVDSSGTADDSSAVIPIGGPWLGDIQLADFGTATSEVLS